MKLADCPTCIDSIAFESPLAVRNALASFEATVADFPNCLIVAKASHTGCSPAGCGKERTALLAICEPLERCGTLPKPIVRLVRTAP